MLKGTLKFGQKLFEVIINGNNLMFFDVASGQITTTEGLRFDKTGVIKEFPDLKDDDDWKKKAIERLKEHMKKLDTEEKKMEYVGDELEKFGNERVIIQKVGFRPKKWVK